MFTRHPSALATGATALLAMSCVALVPTSVSRAAELVTAPILTYDLSATAPSPAPAPADVDADAQQASAAPVTAVAIDAASVECMAKVVLHEAGNQPRVGKIAVAQTLVNRLKAGRFGDTICGVVNQRGQFFHIANFNPRRDTDGWQDAVEVAHQVLAGQVDTVAPGAMFFRASYAPANSFFRTRQRVTTVGAHIFYR